MNAVLRNEFARQNCINTALDDEHFVFSTTDNHQHLSGGHQCLRCLSPCSLHGGWLWINPLQAHFGFRKAQNRSLPKCQCAAGPMVSLSLRLRTTLVASRRRRYPSKQGEERGRQTSTLVSTLRLSIVCYSPAWLGVLICESACVCWSTECAY